MPLFNRVGSLHDVGRQIMEQMSEIVKHFGRGEMEHIMTNKHDSEAINAVAMTTPVIVKSRSLLRRFVTELKVLLLNKYIYSCLVLNFKI